MNQFVQNEIAPLVDRTGLQAVNDNDLERLLNRHHRDGFIIVANGNCSGSLNENLPLHSELKNMVRSRNFSFVPLWVEFTLTGATRSDTKILAPMLLIPNHRAASIAVHTENNLVELGYTICEKFSQDSFMYKVPAPDPQAYFIHRGKPWFAGHHENSIANLVALYLEELGVTDSCYSGLSISKTLYLNKSPIDTQAALKRYGEQFFNLPV